MNRIIRKIWLPMLIITGLMLSFFAGRWAGRLQQSLSKEVAYPWALHKKIGAIDISCNKLSSAPKVGNFIVNTIDDGATLIIVSYNQKENLVTASLIDSGGRYATDSWAIECRQ